MSAQSHLSAPSSRFSPAAAMALALSALLWNHNASAEVPQVPVVQIGAQAVSTGLELDGSLQAVRQSTLSAQASGRITALNVKAGDRVKAGQVLVVIDDRETRAGMAQSQASAAQAEAQLNNAQAQFDRTRELRTKGFVADRKSVV